MILDLLLFVLPGMILSGLMYIGMHYFSYLRGRSAFNKQYGALNPKNCAVLVTGCSRGIGYAAVHLLAQEGFLVYATARDLLDLSKFENLERVTPLQMDILDQADIDKALEFISSDLKSKNRELIGLYNNAGISNFKLFENISQVSDGWKIIENNVKGTMMVTKSCIPLLKASGNGRILIACSLLSSVPIKLGTYYNTSQAALAMFGRCLAQELVHSSNIHVCVQYIGYINSKLTSSMMNSVSEHYGSDQTSQVIRRIYSQLLKVENSCDLAAKDAYDQFTRSDPPMSSYVGDFGRIPTYAMKSVMEKIPEGMMLHF